MRQVPQFLIFHSSLSVHTNDNILLRLDQNKLLTDEGTLSKNKCLIIDLYQLLPKLERPTPGPQTISGS